MAALIRQRRRLPGASMDDVDGFLSSGEHVMRIYLGEYWRLITEKKKMESIWNSKRKFEKMSQEEANAT